MDANPGLKMAVFDHICSQPAFILPIKRLIAAARQRYLINNKRRFSVPKLIKYFTGTFKF